MNEGHVELLLDGGTVVTLDERRRILSPGWVAMDDDRIVGTGTDNAPKATNVVDCTGDLVLPGFVNGHAHLLGAFVRGMGGDRFTNLGADADRPTVAIRAVMDDVDAYAAARVALVEMQLAGVTSTTDSQPALRGLEGQADGTLRALRESGMGATFYRASIDRTDFFTTSRHDTPTTAVAEIGRLRNEYESDRLSIGVEPMALHRVTDQLLTRLIELAIDHDLPLAIHGPYSSAAAEHARERWGASAIGVLHEMGALGSRSLIHHPVVVDDEDVGVLAETHTGVSVCAVDNMLIGTGPAPLRRLLDAGVRVSLGLDQPNDGHDMIQLMKLTLLSQRGGGELWGTPERVLELATVGGADVMGIDAGVIEPDRWADVIVVDGSHPSLLPRHTAISNLVLAAGPQAIRRVYTRGKLAVEDGRHLRWDVGDVVAEAHDAMRRCLERAGLPTSGWSAWDDERR